MWGVSGMLWEQPTTSGSEREKTRAKRWEMRSAGTRCRSKPGLGSFMQVTLACMAANDPGLKGDAMGGEENCGMTNSGPQPGKLLLEMAACSKILRNHISGGWLPAEIVDCWREGNIGEDGNGPRSQRIGWPSTEMRTEVKDSGTLRSAVWLWMC